MRAMAKASCARRAAGALLISGLTIVAGPGLEGRPAGQQGPAVGRPVPAALAAPARPPIPSDLEQFWLVPAPAARPAPGRPALDFAAALRHLSQNKPQRALPLLESAARSAPLASYAAYYRGLCLLALDRPAQARLVFARLHAQAGAAGFVAEAAIGREAEAAAASNDHDAAVRLYEDLLARKPAAVEPVLLALGKELLAAGDRPRAAETLSRIHFEFPASDQADEADQLLADLGDALPALDAETRARLDLARAERLFAARKYQAARQAFEPLAPGATGDAADLIPLRLAECDHFLKRYQQARDRLAPLLDKGPRRAEARFFHLSATRAAGDKDEFVRLVHEMVAASPDSAWSEEALDSLATHHILADEDEQADAVFRELYAKFPTGAYAERAAWRAGWWAYAHGHPADTVSFYEGASASFPRSDYRPSYLYWSARARERLGDTQGAAAVYRTVVADYANSYYGRLAARRHPVAAPATGDTGTAVQPLAIPAAPPPTAGAIRLLVANGLYEPARDELLYAQRVWGDSPALSATLGWVYNKLGDYRRGIIAMKRAYPQYIGQGGARMPADALKVIFPVDYWPIISRHAAARGLDPYLVAALVNQESAYDARIKSAAGAIGLMQILPSTGRQYARKLRIRRYSTAALTRPETNVQIGTAYFADIVARAGGVHLALAGYNAGESRVRQWVAERGAVDTDEFIDGIPFPETQGYVRRILGTAEDYRRLYGQRQ